MASPSILHGVVTQLHQFDGSPRKGRCRLVVDEDEMLMLAAGKDRRRWHHEAFGLLGVLVAERDLGGDARPHRIVVFFEGDLDRKGVCRFGTRADVGDLARQYQLADRWEQHIDALFLLDPAHQSVRRLQRDFEAVLAVDLEQHLASADLLIRLDRALRDRPAVRGDERGFGEVAFRDIDPRSERFDLLLSGIAAGGGGVQRGKRHPAVVEQTLLTAIILLGILQARFGLAKLGFGGEDGELIGLAIHLRKDVANIDAIADINLDRHHLAADLEADMAVVDRLHQAGDLALLRRGRFAQRLPLDGAHDILVDGHRFLAGGEQSEA